jgi:hypothetical protein
MNRLVASKSNSLQYSRFHPSPSVSNLVVMHAQTAGVANSFTSFMVQKNQLILDYLTNPNVANLTASVWEYVNFCDDSFDAFLNQSLDAAKTADKFQVLFNIRNELLFARQRKLQDAERILHSVLSVSFLSCNCFRIYLICFFFYRKMLVAFLTMKKKLLKSYVQNPA